jgi:nicotinamide-nucleotide amidase
MAHLEELNTRLAGEIRELLESTDERLVCAESCTAGLVAATLAKWPGISSWLCGSLVVYQTDIKHQWLGIEPDLLNDPSIGPVSKPVTGLLSIKALEKTPQATLSVAVTGHLGPGAPEELDGCVFVALAQRSADGSLLGSERSQIVVEQMFRLKDAEGDLVTPSTDYSGRQLREDRMLRAVSHVLMVVCDFLKGK